jgi:hypothetical protein
MVFTKFKQVPEDRDCSWNFRDALDVANICAISPLRTKLAMSEIS